MPQALPVLSRGAVPCTNPLIINPGKTTTMPSSFEITTRPPAGGR